MKYTFLLFIAVVLSSEAMAGSQSHQTHDYFYPLKSGHFQYIESSTLEGPTAFHGMPGEDNCFKLNVEGKFIDWIYKAVKTNSTLILFKCIDSKEHTYADGSISGDFDVNLYELESKVLKQINVPGLSHFHNGTFCGEKFAFWGTSNPLEYDATIYDVEKRKVIKRTRLGKFAMESDATDLLPSPIWDNSCDTVTFKEHLYMSEPVSISLK